MSFLYPNFLFGLFTILIPIIIHLFNFRTYKTVYFSNVSFLKEIHQETKSKSNIKHLLVLIARILTITSLVIAFAQPFFPDKKNVQNTQNRKIGIYIDNSFSSEAETQSGKLIEAAKNKALSIISAFPSDTKYIFLTNEFLPKHQHFVSKDQIIDFITETTTCPEVLQTSEVYNKIRNLLTENNSETRSSIYLISDFQKTSTDIEKLENDTTINTFLLPMIPELSNNVYIDSIWFENPNQAFNMQNDLFVSITNKSNQDYQNIPINLYINDTLKAPGSFNISPNTSTIEKLTYTNNKTGILSCKLEISDYPITFDNTFYFSYKIDEVCNILIISSTQTSPFIENIFNKNPYFNLNYTSESNMKPSEFGNYDVIIFDGIKTFSSGTIQETVNFISEGGVCSIFPTIQSDFNTYNQFLQKINADFITGIDTSKIFIDEINYNSSLFKNVFNNKSENPDLPIVKQRVKFSNSVNSKDEILLKTEKGEKILSKVEFGSGSAYIFSTSANEKSGNFVLHPLWIPVIYNIAILKNIGDNLFYTIGKNQSIKINTAKTNSEEVLHIKDNFNKTDFIPKTGKTANGKQITLFQEGNIKQSGNYYIYSNNKKIKGISYNYNRKESDLKFNNIEEINKKLQSGKNINIKIIEEEGNRLLAKIENDTKNSNIYKIFVIIALIFISFEIILLRFLK